MKTRKRFGNRLTAVGRVVVFLTGLAMLTALHAAEPTLRLDLGGGADLELVLIRGGDFTQGSPADETGRGTDEDQRRVTITRDYYMGRSSVTRAQWERFVAETGYRSEAETGTSGGYGWDGSALVQKKSFTWRNPGFAQTGAHPACLLTFPDAEAFCKWVERKTRRKTTLPTEAQWEYACRAGTTTPWRSGASADEAAWHKGNAQHATHPMDSKPANAWGLFIGGNVSEWCLDWHAPYQAGPVTDPLQENPNLSDKPRRVLRGGSWNRDAKNTRSAARYRADPRSRNADIGFRIVCATEVIATPPAPPKPEPPMPQVELEPGATPPMPAPVSHQEMPMEPKVTPRGLGSAVGGLLSILLGLLIPIGLIILFVRLIAGHGKKQTANPFVAPPPRPMPPALRQQVRIVKDGFWIHGDWQPGTPLTVRHVTGGVATALDLVYQPGPQGQFIFTGSAPESASVVTGGEDMPPDPIHVEPPSLRDFQETRRPSNPQPPIFPSAY